MEILTVKVGLLGTNCYIVYDNKTRESIVIDPGADPDKILNEINTRSLKVKYIVLTHGHFDHIAGVRQLKDALGDVRTAIHKDDVHYLYDDYMNLSYMAGLEMDNIECDILLNDGDKLEAGNILFEIIHTPGHTKGGICLLTDGAIFTGDTMFDRSIGRTDFPGGDLPQLVNSIKTKLFTLEGDYIVYPGHEGRTTLEREKRLNPYVLMS